MKAINIFALTRVDNVRDLTRYERQMSNRTYFLKVRDWEIKGLSALTDRLIKGGVPIDNLNFFYSYTIPKLGKEFDLLRINDDTIINIELKSHAIDRDRVRSQLMLNRSYLASLGRSIRSYTYVSSEDILLRLSNSGNLLDESWDTLCRDLAIQENCTMDNIDRFFREEKYLISPLTDPDRFLKGNYFLTSQQKDIRKQILNNIQKYTTKQIPGSIPDNPERGIIQGFTGLPGTGKTLLLYDIAMELTKISKKLIVLHYGSFPDEMKKLDDRLKRIDFFPAQGSLALPDLDSYDYIFVDEGHRMNRRVLNGLAHYSKNTGKPVVISYDFEALISPNERPLDTGEAIDQLPDIIRYRLTNRIRMNSELSSFICCLMRRKGNHRLKSYPSVALSYANNEEESRILLDVYTDSGYTYIADNSQSTCREFDRVVMVIDDTFYYDDDGFLRCTAEGEYKVRRLFHGLNRAKSSLSIIVTGNPGVFDVLLFIAQGH
ncbi:MAG: ATP-binding protein [Lachnospiraceae bacterium]|nr:ATP-binding protein [Lachnospiraceae bacterium]